MCSINELFLSHASRSATNNTFNFIFSWIYAAHMSLWSDIMGVIEADFEFLSVIFKFKNSCSSALFVNSYNFMHFKRQITYYSAQLQKEWHLACLDVTREPHELLLDCDLFGLLIKLTTSLSPSLLIIPPHITLFHLMLSYSGTR